jgi:hypothetical protein
MTSEQIEKLDLAWDFEGFFGKLRYGSFDKKLYNDFLQLLKGISFNDEDLIPKRVVALLWYIPLFMEWNMERVQHQVTSNEYFDLKTLIINELERIFGIP